MTGYALDVVWAAIASFAVLAVVFGPLERLFPARRQRLFRPDFGLDLAFFTGQYLVWNLAALALLSALAARLCRPSAPPGWLTCVAAVVLGDLLVYGFHRACHQVPWLWRFHVVHHSSEHLDWLAAHREHPVDGILTQLCQNLPAMLMGVPAVTLAALAVFRGMWAIFVHSNIRLPLGPLRFLLGAPELHHWHHARGQKTTHNFANLAPWIDWLFGTHHLPSPEERYALGLDEPHPRRYFAMLVTPFWRRAWRAARDSRQRSRTAPAR